MIKSKGGLSADINDVVAELCTPLTERNNPTFAAMLRAIGFFQLQSRIIAPDNDGFQEQAAALATVKFLKSLEGKAKRTSRCGPASDNLAFRKLNDFLTIRKISKDQVSQAGCRRFQAEQKRYLRRVEINASMIELARKFKRECPANLKLMGGQSMVVSVMHEARKKERGFGMRTLGDGLASAGSFSLLQYLLLRHFRQLLAPSLELGGDEFCKTLLRLSAPASAAEFFAAYQPLQDELCEQFPTPKITCMPKNRMPTGPLKLEPLSSAEKTRIRGHYQIKGKGLFQ